MTHHDLRLPELFDRQKPNGPTAFPPVQLSAAFVWSVSRQRGPSIPSLLQLNGAAHLVLEPSGTDKKNTTNYSLVTSKSTMTRKRSVRLADYHRGSFPVTYDSAGTGYPICSLLSKIIRYLFNACNNGCIVRSSIGLNFTFSHSLPTVSSTFYIQLVLFEF
ncbi:hypothetical protein Tsp_02581 [Trichinella spiralis]|uniref:hypothetical protein n=1 Tax=Trichinella spiralis TaxID=6334 RepID=UPI0001EFB7DC|nr:hypothetical protein Tsp_02581 [Trichinella spiralis]